MAGRGTVWLRGSAVVATMIGTANLLSRLYYDMLENAFLAVCFFRPVRWRYVLLLLLLCCCTCYHRLARAGLRAAAAREVNVLATEGAGFETQHLGSGGDRGHTGAGGRRFNANTA